MVAIALVSSALGTTVGVDALHGLGVDNLGSGRSYDNFRATMQQAGYTVLPLTSFTATDLSRVDALIIRQASDEDTSYSPEEIDAIQGFVAAGHGLLLIGEGGYETDSTLENFNLLAAPFGASFGPEALGGPV